MALSLEFWSPEFVWLETFPPPKQILNSESSPAASFSQDSAKLEKSTAVSLFSAAVSLKKALRAQPRSVALQ